jgi:hypothetical protein
VCALCVYNCASDFAISMGHNVVVHDATVLRIEMKQVCVKEIFCILFCIFR